MSSTFTPTVQPWSVVGQNNEYSTPIFNLLKQQVRVDGPPAPLEGTFYILEAPAWVNVIPITPQNEVVLVEQYRHGTQEPTLEIPGGMVDAGENPATAARREMREETGYVAENWTSLGKVSANPAILTNFTHMYVAEGCTQAHQQQTDTNERIAIHTVPMQHFLRMAADGTIHHAIVLAAVARLLLQRPALHHPEK